MEEFNYSNLGNKLNRKIQSNEIQNDEVYLSDLFEASDYSFYSNQVIAKTFCNELKRCLTRVSIKDIIENIFRIEAELDQLKFHVESDIEIPSMEGFYKNLSPTLLRSVWENVLGEFKEMKIKHGWLESIRIALEQELYIWQEKSIDE